MRYARFAGFAVRSNSTSCGRKLLASARAGSGPTRKWRSSMELTNTQYQLLLSALRAKCEALTSTTTDLISSLQTTATTRKQLELPNSERKARTCSSEL